MKYIISYGLWLAAIASYILLFKEPNSPYIAYANNAITIYEVVCWVVFVIAGVSTLLLSIVSHNPSLLEVKSEGKEEDLRNSLQKALDGLNKEKWFQRFLRYVHYVFIVFVGFFVGDISMTFVLTANAIFLIMLKSNMTKILKEAVNANEFRI